MSNDERYIIISDRELTKADLDRIADFEVREGDGRGVIVVASSDGGLQINTARGFALAAGSLAEALLGLNKALAAAGDKIAAALKPIAHLFPYKDKQEDEPVEPYDWPRETFAIGSFDMARFPARPGHLDGWPFPSGFV